METATSSLIREDCREWGRLSESGRDCQKVGEIVRKSGRLSKSRGDCQKVGETVREWERLSESRRFHDDVVRERGRHQGGGDVVKGAGMSSRGWGRRQGSGDVTVIIVLLQSPSRAMLLLQCCRIGQNCMPLHGA